MTENTVTEPLTFVRDAIKVAEREGLENEKEILEQAHNEIVENRASENEVKTE